LLEIGDIGEIRKKAAAILGSIGGKAGGKARASIPGEMSRLGKLGTEKRIAATSAARRSEIASNAVKKRYADMTPEERAEVTRPAREARQAKKREREAREATEALEREIADLI